MAEVGNLEGQPPSCCPPLARQARRVSPWENRPHEPCKLSHFQKPAEWGLESVNFNEVVVESWVWLWLWA